MFRVWAAVVILSAAVTVIVTGLAPALRFTWWPLRLLASDGVMVTVAAACSFVAATVTWVLLGATPCS